MSKMLRIDFDTFRQLCEMHEVMSDVSWKLSCEQSENLNVMSGRLCYQAGKLKEILSNYELVKRFD